MTVMLLALLFSDAALTASEAAEPAQLSDTGGSSKRETRPQSAGRPWSPRVKSWSGEAEDCPVFFQRDVAGFGTLRVGPRCTPVHDPIAL